MGGGGERRPEQTEAQGRAKGRQEWGPDLGCLGETASPCTHSPPSTPHPAPPPKASRAGLMGHAPRPPSTQPSDNQGGRPLTKGGEGIGEGDTGAHAHVWVVDQHGQLQKELQ